VKQTPRGNNIYAPEYFIFFPYIVGLMSHSEY